ncbi:hypothetical protein ACI0FM_08750 [Paenochrobactrum sp. BZR 588]|uniref:hypothetical protein n=1 Tax=unclassified Paenochrobactrum TaxID=2639760 RepID=UPI0038518EDA
MFKITLSPQFSDQILKIEKRGSVLTIGNKSCDFEQLADGSEIPAEAIENDCIVGGITKTNGIVNVTVLMPYSDVVSYSNADAPERIRFPEPIMMIDDGEIIFNEKVAADD